MIEPRRRLVTGSRRAARPPSGIAALLSALAGAAAPAAAENLLASLHLVHGFESGAACPQRGPAG